MLYSPSDFYLRRSILVHRNTLTLFRLLIWKLSALSLYSLILLLHLFILSSSTLFPFLQTSVTFMCPKKTFNYLSFLDSPNSICQLLFIHTLSLTLYISLSATLSLSLLLYSSLCLSLSLPSSLSLRHSSPPSPLLLIAHRCCCYCLMMLK